MDYTSKNTTAPQNINWLTAIGLPIRNIFTSLISLFLLSFFTLGVQAQHINNHKLASNNSNLSVAACPTITTQPVSQTDCKGNGVEFTAAFNAGGASVTYQWQSSTDSVTWTYISGALPNIIGASGTTLTSPIVLTVNNVGVGGSNGVNLSGTQYRVIITDASIPCSVTSDGIATLTVNQITGISPS